MAFIWCLWFLSPLDTNLERMSHYWFVQPYTERHTTPWILFSYLRTSEHLSRFSLSTLSARYRHLMNRQIALKKTIQAKEYYRRIHYIQSFYLRIPHSWYLLDRTLYGYHWGLIALGFF